MKVSPKEGPTKTFHCLKEETLIPKAPNQFGELSIRSRCCGGPG